ncbi:MAG: hypothetical protein ACR2QO_02415 [Acidimicrobiales bacterium]
MSEPRELDRAAFVISIDTEMAWGQIHHQDDVYRYDDERVHLRRLLDLFDRFDVPATWAIVGHLMLDRCEPIDGVKHPEIVRPDFDWFDGDWFEQDPSSDTDHAPEWYAPDVLHSIRSASTSHEIASHGFSHIIAGDPGCSRATFDSELRAAVQAADDRGVALRSFIHPRNRIGHNDVLADHNIRAYRGRRPASAGHRSIGQRVEDVLRASERTIVRPLFEDPLWNFPATTMFTVDARRRTWQLWIRQVERRLSQAVSHRSLFHLWFHPHNLRANPEASFAALERICRAASEHRDAGELDTVTMGDLAERLSEMESARSSE